MAGIVPLLLALAVSAGAFEIPLTSRQRAQKLVEEGYELITRGDYLGALSSCDKALQVRNDWAPAYVCRSEARLWMKDPQSDRDARQALRFDPDSGDPYRLLGLWEYESGRYQAAIQNFSRALELSKLKPEGVTECYYYRARSRIRVGDLTAAREDVSHGLGVLRGVSGAYGDWSFYSLRAEIHRKEGDLERADADEKQVLALIEERLKRHPAESADLLRRRAHSSALLGDFDRAATDLGELLGRSMDPEPRLLMERSLALVMAGRYADAVKDLDQVLLAEPGRPLARRMRALARIAAGDAAGATADLDTFLAGKPSSDGEAPKGARQALLEDGSALAELEAGQPSGPARNPGLLARQALVQEMLLSHDAALETGARALSSGPDEALAHIARAQAATSSQRCAETRASHDWLVSRFPERGYHLWLRGECRCRQGDLAGCVADLERTVALEKTAKLPALRLASQRRRLLDEKGRAAGIEEFGRLLRDYDHAGALAPLEVSDRLGRLQTLVDYAALAPGAEGRDKLKEAGESCRQLSREEPRDPQLRRTCREIERRLVPAKRRRAAATAPKRSR